MNENEFNMYNLLDLDIFENLSKLEDYLDITIQFHPNYRYVDTYNRYRETLFHGENLIGIDYSMEQSYAQKYLSPSSDNPKHLYSEYLDELNHMYIIEQLCKHYAYTFSKILCIYLHYPGFHRLSTIFRLIQWKAHPYLKEKVTPIFGNSYGELKVRFPHLNPV